MTDSLTARHRRQRRPALALTATGAVVALGAAAGFGFLHGGADASGCPQRTVRVAAAASVAPVVKEVAATLTSTGCTSYDVRVADRPGDADAWIAESSRWTGAQHVTSVATTPVVLALPSAMARKLGPAPTYEGLTGVAGASRLRAPALATSAVTQAAVADLTASLGAGGPEQRGLLAALLRSTDTAAGGDPTAATGDAVLTTQAAVSAHPGYVAVRAASGGTELDYPFAVLAADLPQRLAARRLLAALRDSGGRAAFARAAFGPAATSHTRVLTVQRARVASNALAILKRPTRTLAVVDVSGSMAQPVPGAPGATRISLAREAIRAGVALLPPGTVAGLWRFSANLTPSTDYEQVAPLTELTASTRPFLDASVDRLQVDPEGGTGLYSSTLAAVRYMRSGYDPSRVNSVIVLSDGKDQDATTHGVTLAALMRTLRAEADPKRPVQVIGIAYGPDSDAAAMRAIVTATGGTLYTAREPRDLPVILRQAIGNRLCRGGGC